jgi:hypothetical protein
MISLSMNLQKFKDVPDKIPANISVLQFKLDSASSDVTVVIKNKNRSEVIHKKTDSSGIFQVQAISMGDNVAEIPMSWFDKDAGYFYLKIFAGSTPVLVDDLYDVVRFSFEGVEGYGDNYTIDLTTDTPAPSSGVGEDQIGSTLQVY